MLKIGISAINFLPGKMGGVETYIRNLVHHLQLIKNNDRYILLCDKRHASEFPLFNPAITPVTYSASKPSLGWFLRGVARNTIKVDFLQHAIDRINLDVIHHPFSVLSPMGLCAPSVLTFWDMQHEFFPDFFSPAELKERRVKYRLSADKATRIIVSALFTKECLVERYGVDSDKIDVIYTGYGPEYKHIEDIEALELIRHKYGLFKKFLFYPAATWPHKNHKNLLAAFRLLKDQCGFDGELVLTGIAMQSQGQLLQEIKQLGLTDNVRILGYLPYEDLPLLYNLANLLVFPSLFEGFGIPLVEAMACRCPIVCSNVTSLPEVLGDAGVTFDPHSPQHIADTIWSVWNNESLRQQMRERGKERVKLFNWENTTLQTLEVYKKAVLA